MSDPKAAALAKALGLFIRPPRALGSYVDLAAAILATLPPDWCGHDRDAIYAEGYLARANEIEATIARLRKIEEAARAWLDWWDAPSELNGLPTDAKSPLPALRAALAPQAPR